MFLRTLPRRWAWLIAVASILCATAHDALTLDASVLPAPAERPVDFLKDIQPIFEAHCVKCHGPEKQKSGWRSDVKAAAMTGGDNYAPNIIAGKSAESPLIHFVAGLEQDMKMPEKGDGLTPEEIGLLRAWIDQGAAWPDEMSKTDPLDWWSLKPLHRPPMPERCADGSKSSSSIPRDTPAPLDSEQPADNGIDSFIQAKLAEHGLVPSSEADRSTLIRRVTFDLTGLPPSPEEMHAFITDPDTKAYEKLVDRLLASPRYGERWARHWLDVVRYGETHGYDKDQQRINAWPYRDYVIRAFNEDKPYARFVQEQVAGDVLFPSTRDGIEALGFISAGPWDLIGHMEVAETKTDGKIARNLDRDDMAATAMNTFASMTVQCARCHNHKFETFIKQEHYYGVQAVFAALDRTERRYDVDPTVARQRQSLEERQRKLTNARDVLQGEAIRAAGAPLQELGKRIATLKKAKPSETTTPAAHGYHSLVAESQEAVKWVQVDLGNPVALEKVVLRPCSDDYNNIGDGFGFPVRFKVEVSNNAEFDSEVTAIADPPTEDLANPRLQAVEFPVPGRTARYIRVTATKLAPRKGDYIFALAELSVFDMTGKNVAAETTVTALDSIEMPPRWQKNNLTDGQFPSRLAAGAPEDLDRLRIEYDAMTNEAMGGEARLRLSQAAKELAIVESEIARLPKPRTVYAGAIHHGSGTFQGTGANGGKPRPIHVLHRGDVNSPRQEVAPGAIPIIEGEPASFSLAPDAPEGERRAALAKWLSDARNPLTWRSIVNRVWQYHFGWGIVDSPNDFGHMGQLPTHPELLDWLAVEFRDGGQSFKKLHRLIVTSATYRQTSFTPAANSSQRANDVDSDNRYLWRMNRRRLEAEAIRDTVLACAGKLDLAMGGPSFQDFIVEQPEHSPHYKYSLHNPEDPKSHRRSIYRLIVRSQPQPFLTTLDCADPSMSVEKRNESISALQALALMNNQLMVAMASHFAARVQTEAPDIGAQIGRAFQLATGRRPSVEEQRDLTTYASQHGLVNACRVIFNLNEFVFVD